MKHLNEKTINSYIGLFSVSLIILIIIIIESPWAKQKRFNDLTSDFRASEFSGVVTRIARDKSDHNNLKIYFGRNQNLDLTWFENRAELVDRIHIGDSISKRKHNKTIRVFSGTTSFEMEVKISQ
ncbi:hypothetical protein D3C87_84650 [compost metagenome]